jgi:hypothetical protein
LAGCRKAKTLDQARLVAWFFLENAKSARHEAMKGLKEAWHAAKEP